ncbi:hypothetical protein LguiA_032461 [Lonicera macranthoides]
MQNLPKTIMDHSRMLPVLENIMYRILWDLLSENPDYFSPKIPTTFCVTHCAIN